MRLTLEKGADFAALILWLVWRAYPGVVTCEAFWLSLVWFIRSKGLIRYSGGRIVLLGVVANALVTELNGGVMPVVGLPVYFRAVSPIWQPAQTSNHWLWLADQASLHFFSIGDLALIGGGSMFILAKLYQRLAKQQF
jgi:hypothetical protein